MNATEILHTAHAFGVIIMQDGNDLLIEAVIPPPEMLLEEIKRQKPQILALLDWQEFYDERAGFAEHSGQMPKKQAEKQAFESCIVRWLDTHPPAIIPDACTHCGKPAGVIGRNAVITATGHYLHHACHAPWLARRREEAIAALADTIIAL